MEDYIDVLLQYVVAQRLHTVVCESPAHIAQEENTLSALTSTFTDEQRRLFRAYDTARSIRESDSEDAYARQAFLLARDIFR